MSENLDDAQRILEQRALRNVRGLLDKIEVEDQNQVALTRKLAIAAISIVGIVFIAVLAVKAIRVESQTAPPLAQLTPIAPTPGTFRILNKGATTAEFEFGGWPSKGESPKREVIAVYAEPGGDINRAIVKRMIQVIHMRTHSDFNWDSRRLGRMVTLSARPEDNDGLEDFLIKEFFGTSSSGSLK